MDEKLDLSSQPVIDDHCHPFQESAKTLTLEQLLSLVSIGGAEYELESPLHHIPKHPRNLLFYRFLVKKLSEFLSCAGGEREILVARNRRSSDLRKYVGELFSDVNMETLMLDDGYSEIAIEHQLPKVDFSILKRFIPVKIARIKRVEPLMQTSLDDSSTFKELIANYESELESAVKKQGCVAFKSITAYRTGLDIKMQDEKVAREEYRIYKERKATAWFGPQVKRLREFLVSYAIEESIKLSVPFQIHTGVGDTDVILERCNPKYLFSLLKEFPDAKIVLVHGGYPYTSEAAYLTNAFPNVHLDLSIIFPFICSNAPRRLVEILELAPTSKVLYGSDGFTIPELHWISAKIGKEVLGDVLGSLVKSATLDEDEAYEAASMILSENSRRLYRLNEQ